MKIKEIVNINTDETTKSYSDVVRALQTRSFFETKLSQIFKEINLDNHDVMDPYLRPDRPVYKTKEKSKGKNVGLQGKKTGDGEADDEKEFLRTEYVNRITIPFQQLVCDQRVSFCLANPVRRIYLGISDDEVVLIKTPLEAVLHDNMIESHDLEAGREIFTYTETAEFWQVIEEKESTNRYGFSTNKKIRVVLYTRKDGYKFYPLKDRTGKLVCFSVEYRVKEQGKNVTYLDVYTDEEQATFKKTGVADWLLVESKAQKSEGGYSVNAVGKIPFSFGWQRHPEYKNCERIVARLEKLLSNHAEINDYHAAPKLFLTEADKITGIGSKGDAAIVLQGKGNADAKYITWEHSTQSVKDEIETLLMLYWTITRTANISFDNLKGFGAVSGIAIKLMFMNSHLAVKDKQGVLLDFFQRRNSIICAMLGQMKAELKPIIDKVRIKNELDPFMIADEKENAEIAQIQNGNKATKSQETTVYEAGGDNKEFLRLTAQQDKENLNDITSPTI